MKIWAFEMNGREQRAHVPRKDEKLDFALMGHGLLYRYENGDRAGFKAYEAPHRRQLAQMFQALRNMGERPHQLRKPRAFVPGPSNPTAEENGFPVTGSAA
jgi:hypothetical protein